ncbi:T9SS type A sorting domain-containing protein [Hymenobacter negativus]|uniref:T9SS type A sorting domain-containing protein n=1 Tax=Hymenobacter negativus TaxID=2795026 RepID=A0ABS3QIF0_9BACT|nr:T9SS type A sorting domain-containing protein [Hymenobacter negativus]MBO2010569.1 T9SS type A sorting domain-containing protein [Hymenobacter negativus]
MKKTLLAASHWRQLLSGGLLMLLFAGSFQLALETGPKTKQELVRESREEEEEEDEAEDGDRVFADRPDLALEQEAALTRDPATGTVPRERLTAAAAFNQTALTSQALQRPTSGNLAGATWVERGPSNVAGRILGLLVDPADATGSTIWAGSAGGGLWKGTNAKSPSVQWRNVNASLTNLAVTTVAAVPGSSPEVLYCGTGEGYFNVDAIQGAGIWKSTDGGATWARLASTNNANFYFVQKIAVQPTTGEVYAATRNGLWRSQNAGSTWSLVLSGTATRVADVEIGADNTVYAALGIFNTDGIYRSTTGNSGSWTKLNTLAGSGLPTTGYQRIELACAPSDANRLYAVFQTTTTNSLLNIYRSTDKGNTWVVMGRPGGSTTDYTNGQAWYNLAISVSPSDPNAVYLGGLDLWFTSDAGNATPGNIAWDQESVWNAGVSSSYYVHADHHAIAFVPTATAPANQAYFGSDGGVAYSADASTSNATEPTFSQRNNGLNVTQFYALAMHPTNFNYFLAGAQDNGTQKFTTAGLGTTTMATSGDGGFCAIDQTNANAQFTSYVYNQYRRSTNGGASFTNFNISASIGSFINPWEYDSQADVLYACHNADFYLAWTNPLTATSVAAATTLTPGLGTGAGKVTHITVSPLTANRIYVGTNAGKLLRVDNANTATPAVTTLRTGTAGTSVSCVAVDPTNEKHLLLTYSNYGTVSVYETTNADAASPTWTSVENLLPDMPVRWALFDPTNTTRALLATEMGVYTTEQLSGSATVWTPASNGLVNTRVDMLRYRPGDKLVGAATHGRGLFTSNVLDPAAPLPVTLLRFTGSRTPEGIELGWQTASELKSSYFDIERAIDAVNYQPLGRVAAAGTSTSRHIYSYLDAKVEAGRPYYYRLRQVDLDGTSAYSPVVVVAVPAGGTAPALLTSVFPNPFSSELTVALGQDLTEAITISLADAAGRRVFSTTQRPAARQLTVRIPASLVPGSYVLTASSGGQRSSQRVEKR